jgi:hypothetical protein
MGIMKHTPKIRIAMVVALALSVVPVGPAFGQDGSSSVSGMPCFASVMDDNLTNAAISDSVSVDTAGLDLKSEGAALRYSLLGTLLPVATLVFAGPGLIVGPSAGYFYAGMPGRAWTGIGIRTIGVGGIVSSFIICGWDCGPGQSGYNEAWAVFIAGAGIVTISAIYDIGTVEAAVRKRNNSLMKLGDAITPMYFEDSRAFGVRLAYRF